MDIQKSIMVIYKEVALEVWDQIPAKSIAVMFKKNKSNQNFKTEVKIYCAKLKN